MAQRQTIEEGNSRDPVPYNASAGADKKAKDDAFFNDVLNPSSPNYVGPAYDRAYDAQGNPSPVLTTDSERLVSQKVWEENKNPATPIPALPADPGPTAETLPETPGQDAGPPQVDRTRIDEILGKVDAIGAELLKLGLSDDKYSSAQAQLALSTAAAQKQALQLARSGNRRDRAGNEARAVFAGSELSAEGARSAAVLRAQEEEANKKIKLDALGKAGELGLNAGALDINAQSLDMTAVTAYLNNVFEQNNIKYQINQQEAERLTNFIRDMALIAQDYYALGQDEKQSIRDDLTRRYGFDQQLQGITDQLDAEPGFWEKAGIGLISALPAAAALAKSDRRAKENISNTTESDLEELLKAVNSKTFDYKNPQQDGQGRQIGQMAQDLQKSKLGAAMVHKNADGSLMVDSGKAGLAALSGLSLVFDKLKELEKAL